MLLIPAFALALAGQRSQTTTWDMHGGFVSATTYTNGQALHTIPDLAKLRAKAETGDDVAQLKLSGQLRSIGLQAEGEHWLRCAATNGNIVAQASLGRDLLGTTNKAAAFHWTQQAANQGHWSAQAMLAHFCQRGFQTETNLVEAMKWALLSSSLEDKQGQAARAAIEPLLSEEERLEAEARAGAFLAGPTRNLFVDADLVRLTRIEPDASGPTAWINGLAFPQGGRSRLPLAVPPGVEVTCILIRSNSVVVSLSPWNTIHELKLPD